MSYERAPYGCRQCGQHYTSRRKLEAHLKTHREITRRVIGGETP